jgi:hypothetical protein
VISLYDPRTNILSKTTYDYLAELTGMSKGNLRTHKCLSIRISLIGCYITDDKVTVKQRKFWYETEKYPNETWKAIQGSDNKYIISTYGRFKRLYKSHNGFLLPFKHNRDGFMMIKVKFNGKYAQYKIATLVAYHFLDKPHPGEVLYHKNLIKTDDFVGNLEYILNSKLGEKTGFKSKSKAVIQFDRFTGEVLGEYRSAREAGRNCYLSYQAVLDCCNHKSKTSGGYYIFKWADEIEKNEAEDRLMFR